MSDIPQRQNEERLLKYLAAMRQLYAEDKRRGYGGLVMTAIVTEIGTAVRIYFPQAAAPSNFIVLVVAIIGVLLPMFSKHRVYAADVHELFDCTLLKLEWNDALAEPPTETFITHAVTRFQGRKDWQQASMNLRNWYENPYIASEPLTIAIIACQLENVRYGDQLRRLWGLTLVSAATGLFFLMLFVGIIAGWTLPRLFLGVVPLFAPLLIGALQNAVRHFEVASKLDRLALMAQQSLHDAQQGTVDDVILAQRSRAFQDELYHARRDYLDVPNWWRELSLRLSRRYIADRDGDSSPVARQ